MHSARVDGLHRFFLCSPGSAPLPRLERYSFCCVVIGHDAMIRIAARLLSLHSCVVVQGFGSRGYTSIDDHDDDYDFA